MAKKFKDTWVGKTLSSFVSRITGSALTGAEREANAFSAEQAQISRDWSESQYLKYNSPQALVDQYEQAGINPALMFGGQPLGAGDSSSAPASVSPSPGEGITGILNAILGVKQAAADIKLKDSQSRKNDAETSATETLTPLRAAEIVQSVDLSKHQVGYYDAMKDVQLADAALKGTQNELAPKYYAIEEQYKAVQNAHTEADRARIFEQIHNMKQEFAESVARTMMYRANAGMLDQQTLNLAEEYGLIKINKEIGQYQVEHLDGDRVWNRISTGAGILRDAGLGFGGAVSGITAGAGRTIVRGFRQNVR